MKLKITTNFDFSKLSNKVGKLVEKYVEQNVIDVADGAKNKIDQNTLPRLSKITKRIRKSKGLPENPPLKATGRLYKSIKPKKNALEIYQYGKWHNDGIPEISDKHRRFINTRNQDYFKSKKKRKEVFIEELRKNLRKTKG